MSNQLFSGTPRDNTNHWLNNPALRRAFLQAVNAEKARQRPLEYRAHTPSAPEPRDVLSDNYRADLERRAAHGSDPAAGIAAVHRIADAASDTTYSNSDWRKWVSVAGAAAEGLPAIVPGEAAYALGPAGKAPVRQVGRRARSVSPRLPRSINPQRAEAVLRERAARAAERHEVPAGINADQAEQVLAERRAARIAAGRAEQPGVNPALPDLQGGRPPEIALQAALTAQRHAREDRDRPATEGARRYGTPDAAPLPYQGPKTAQEAILEELGPLGRAHSGPRVHGPIKGYGPEVNYRQTYHAVPEPELGPAMPPEVEGTAAGIHANLVREALRARQAENGRGPVLRPTLSPEDAATMREPLPAPHRTELNPAPEPAPTAWVDPSAITRRPSINGPLTLEQQQAQQHSEIRGRRQHEQLFDELNPFGVEGSSGTATSGSRVLTQTGMAPEPTGLPVPAPEAGPVPEGPITKTPKLVEPLPDKPVLRLSNAERRIALDIREARAAGRQYNHNPLYVRVEQKMREYELALQARREQVALREDTITKKGAGPNADETDIQAAEDRASNRTINTGQSGLIQHKEDFQTSFDNWRQWQRNLRSTDEWEHYKEEFGTAIQNPEHPNHEQLVDLHEFLTGAGGRPGLMAELRRAREEGDVQGLAEAYDNVRTFHHTVAGLLGVEIPNTNRSESASNTANKRDIARYMGSAGREGVADPLNKPQLEHLIEPVEQVKRESPNYVLPGGRLGGFRPPNESSTGAAPTKGWDGEGLLIPGNDPQLLAGFPTPKRPFNSKSLPDIEARHLARSLAEDIPPGKVGRGITALRELAAGGGQKGISSREFFRIAARAGHEAEMDNGDSQWAVRGIASYGDFDLVPFVRTDKHGGNREPMVFRPAGEAGRDKGVAARMFSEREALRDKGIRETLQRRTPAPGSLPTKPKGVTISLGSPAAWSDLQPQLGHIDPNTPIYIIGYGDNVNLTLSAIKRAGFLNVRAIGPKKEAGGGPELQRAKAASDVAILDLDHPTAMPFVQWDKTPNLVGITIKRAKPAAKAITPPKRTSSPDDPGEWTPTKTR